MIVVDASALVELLLNQERAARVAARVLTGDPIYAPQFLSIEVLSALRRLVLKGELTAERARLFREHYAGLPLVYYPHEHFLERIWELRHNVTAYDAAYISLAEALPATLVSCDSKLAGAAGHRANIELV